MFMAYKEHVAHNMLLVYTVNMTIPYTHCMYWSASSGVVVPDKQLKMAHQSKHGVVKLCRCCKNSILNIGIHGATMSALGTPHVVISILKHQTFNSLN